MVWGWENVPCVNIRCGLWLERNKSVDVFEREGRGRRKGCVILKGVRVIGERRREEKRGEEKRRGKRREEKVLKIVNESDLQCTNL